MKSNSDPLVAAAIVQRSESRVDMKVLKRWNQEGESGGMRLKLRLRTTIIIKRLLDGPLDACYILLRSCGCGFDSEQAR